MTDKSHILVVDDDTRLRALLQKFLGESGFLVTAAASVAEARQKMALLVFDLVILDIMMPGESGLDLTESLHGAPDAPPILLLTALGEAEHRISGFLKGADDYLPKPFEPRELVMRIQAILRRTRKNLAEKREVRFGPFLFDLESQSLSQDGAPVYLTGSEATLLRILAERAGSSVSREELAQATPDTASERSVDVQITRLRKKIEPSAGKPVYIQTVRNAGYVLNGG